MTSTDCLGSYGTRQYTPLQVTARDSRRRASYAKVVCPTCGREFTARVVRTQQGVSLGPEGRVVVPRHRAAQGGQSS